ncbi:DinB family protein [Mesoterricola sediminis]|uniref:DNA damage-inducible protein DinB n=1 Tax=Mesoterricola sediminis TaxID=2927980 RepID=A0AA48GVB4_9BACT|nr:DinB family protein [Mesoterricola sediminis]BDU76934.1 DNA damage-inducible protein DinB [Mesoterricola sediminis]
MPTTLLDHLKDMHDHMAWADAVWFEAWGRSDARGDEDLRARVRHMVDVETAFLQVLDGRDVAFDRESPLPSYEALRQATREHHAAYRALLDGLDPAGLAREVVIPWFPGPPCVISVDEALTQVAMHTQHHRGQLMTRLKDLGGRPLNVDYIIWAWKGRPEGRWT